jgi:hypothetical protein
MRMRILLILLVAMAGLGADCGGGGSSHGDAAGSSSSSFSVAKTGDTRGDLAPVPEPSALLVFGAGLLVAGAATRRNR